MFNIHSRTTLPGLVLAAFVSVVTPACAGQGYYRVQNGPRVDNRTAYDIGYREGFEHGRDDARRGRPADYSRHNEYRRANDGYRGDVGNRRVFQDGFAAGYRDAYRQFDRNDRWRGGRNDDRNGRYQQPGPAGRFRSPAAENGYRDGYAQGRDDGRDRDRFDPVGAKRYRQGDHDYDRRYGSRDDYARDYREAFRRGYEQGYRETQRR